jgi:hypothetical protein
VPARPKAVVFKRERREIASAVIVILGRAALIQTRLRLCKLTAAKNVPPMKVTRLRRIRASSFGAVA